MDLNDYSVLSSKPMKLAKKTRRGGKKGQVFQMAKQFARKDETDMTYDEVKQLYKKAVVDQMKKAGNIDLLGGVVRMDTPAGVFSFTFDKLMDDDNGLEEYFTGKVDDPSKFDAVTRVEFVPDYMQK